MRYPHTMLATCCVPWSEQGELLEDVFRDSIRFQRGHGLDHLYLFGTAGEGHAVTDRQYDQIVAVFAEEMAGASPMVGVISLSTGTVVERIERAAARGVTAFQLSLPSWSALDDAELGAFFDQTVGRFPELTFLHYNLPRARRIVTPAEYAVLSDRHPNLVATKNAGASGQTLDDLFTLAPQLRHYLTEPGYAAAIRQGHPEAGLLLSMSSINPALAGELFAAGAGGDLDTVEQLSAELGGITAALVEALGGGRIDGAYDKCFNRVHDERFPLRLLAPYRGATEAEYAAFAAAVTERYPHWMP
ncbi:hypothetical protein Cme02nite_03230 [Catellatospora methionotrophica]|uniref:Dihydrodipicolinate synthase family protein n=1 Tax=Catellatospora methionotrophica TaxID=121620 RepID=A0A8J3LBH2_9ACTN|nr:dihydrodipicolinate synthase family protein [Catellatospora methionotrophica]GIG11991.1 hypothetical protein Cme02nite_03230 [Catellatospora methionotrophica]